MKLATGLSLLAGTGLLGAAFFSSAAEVQPNENAVRAFMRGKLDASRDVLEGLATEDFEKISHGADQMRVMSLRAEWNVLKTPDYIQHSAEFRSTAEQLGRAAKANNLDGAGLAYLKLTTSCINCHKHVRSKPVATAPAIRSDAIHATAVAWTQTTGDDDTAKQAEPALRKFMRGKLDASGRILEGLATEDYRLIAQGAARLRKMSSAEEWRVSNDAMYRQHSSEFQRIAEQLEKAAKDKRLDSAAFSWMQATMSCIECHKHVRAMMIARELRP